MIKEISMYELEMRRNRVNYWENVSILLSSLSKVFSREDTFDNIDNKPGLRYHYGTLSTELIGHIKASSYFEESAMVYPEISALKRTVLDRASGAIEIVKRSGVVSGLCLEYLLREFDVFRGKFSEFVRLLEYLPSDKILCLSADVLSKYYFLHTSARGLLDIDAEIISSKLRDRMRFMESDVGSALKFEYDTKFKELKSAFQRGLACRGVVLSTCKFL